MRARSLKALAIGTVCVCGLGSALAQGGWSIDCVDPANTTPRTGHVRLQIGNDLFRCHLGIAGTTTYGGETGPCYSPAYTFNLAGRFGFMIGPTGSIQDEPENQPDPLNAAFRDDFMVLTPGMPLDPGGTYCYATLTRNGERTLFGSSGFSVFFTGFSGRYMFAQTTLDTTLVQLTIDLAGDAARLRWVMTNLDTENAANLGLWFGAAIGMLTADAGVTDLNGASQSHFLLSTLTRFGAKLGYLTLPSGRPPITEQRYLRDVDPANFPQTVNFYFGQTAAFGLRIDNGEVEDTADPSGFLTPTQATEFALGNHGTFASPGLLGFGPGDSTFPDTIIGDVDFLDNTAFIQKFPEIPVAPGGQRTVVQIIRPTGSVGSYAGGYAAVLDGPRMVATDPNGLNGLRPNPLTARVYVDNVAGFAGANTEVALNQVKVSINLPPGLALAPGEPFVDLNNNGIWDQNEPGQKIIPVVPPKQVRFVDFSFEADGVGFGDFEYTVKIEPIPGSSKTLKGRMLIATTPKVTINSGANLVTLPWIFQDTSLEAITGLQLQQDFNAYVWDSAQEGYFPASSNERGKGIWFVTETDFGPIDLQSNPTLPPDIPTGAPLIQLKSGWNLIGNPYPYPIKLGQLVGVSGAAPQQSYPWTQLVNQGFVSGSIVFWDNAVQDYFFIQGGDAVIQPNRGYWVFVPTVQDLTVSYPAVFEGGLPGSTRSAGNAWTQGVDQWRLQLSVRTDKSLDAQNYVGIARNASEVRRLRVYEAPISPVHNATLSVEEIVEGRVVRLAQALGLKASRKAWKVVVDTTEAATVTITWPNLATVPKDVSLRLTDRATGEVRDLRRVSGYTFTVDGPANREFTLEATPGGQPVKAVIGNVLVTRPDRSLAAPFTISYTLSAEATTTVRILSSSGREVFTAHRGRADRAGENNVIWTMRDNANRLVAPGSYRAEIIAETTTGERVRRVVPINVIR